MRYLLDGQARPGGAMRDRVGARRPADGGQRHPRIGDRLHPGDSTGPAISSMALSRPARDVVLTGSRRG